VYRANSGRPGMTFTYSLPGASPMPSHPKPLIFRVPVSTIAPVRIPVSTVSPMVVPTAPACRLDSKIIFQSITTGAGAGAIGGGMTAGPPGAVTGALSGIVGGAGVGAYIAVSEKKACDAKQRYNAIKSLFRK